MPDTKEKVKKVSDNSKLKKDIEKLARTIIAVEDFHAALDYLEITGKKYDQMKVVQQKREEYKRCLEDVKSIIEKATN